MKIGLTGSIACGKSTVSQALRSMGYAIVDADAISRALTAPDGQALPALRAAFGDAVFDGSVLRRDVLGQIVFADSAKRDALNALLHPMILDAIARQLSELDTPDGIVVGDIPLLFECHLESWFDRIWVVSAPRAVQIERLIQRDGLSREAAECRIDAQMPLEEKERRADAVIRTDVSLEETLHTVRTLLCALPERRQA